MKSWIKKMVGGVSLTCILAMSSCNNDAQPIAEYGDLPENVPAAVYEDFRACFPDAADVDWSVADGYAVATFTVSKTRSAAPGKTSVWYALKDAQKKMQSRAIAYDALPEAVKTAFAESEYGADTTDAAAGLLMRYATGTVETIYFVRVTTDKGAGTTETTLYYTADGVLVKLATEVIYDGSYSDLNSDYRDWLPQTSPDGVAEFVSRNYPQAEYLYIYAGKSLTKVKILDGRQARLLLFDAAGNWLSTQTQLHAHELPEEILAAFRASEYADCRIDDAAEYLTANDGHYYVLTVKEHSGKKLEIRIGEDGTLDGEGNGNTPSQPGDEGSGSADYLSKTEIDAFVHQRYPDATIVAQSSDDKELEVKLTCTGAEIKVRFELRSQGYVWSESEWKLDIRRPSAVPAAVRETVDDAYAGYELSFLNYVEQASSGNYYEAGLKSAQSKRSIKVKMDEQGHVLAEYGNH
ncbi:MAG: PepSY-like domain-containing protein [Alistipes sp.]|nr:PepSY-like domain-containing protein [Alistipes sp.]